MHSGLRHDDPLLPDTALPVPSPVFHQAAHQHMGESNQTKFSALDEYRIQPRYQLLKYRLVLSPRTCDKGFPSPCVHMSRIAITSGLFQAPVNAAEHAFCRQITGLEPADAISPFRSGHRHHSGG